MNSELQTQLASILAAIQRATSASADFALTHLPDIAQQYVMYGRVSWLRTEAHTPQRLKEMAAEFGVTVCSARDARDGKSFKEMQC